MGSYSEKLRKDAAGKTDRELGEDWKAAIAQCLGSL